MSEIERYKPENLEAFDRASQADLLSQDPYQAVKMYDRITRYELARSQQAANNLNFLKVIPLLLGIAFIMSYCATQIEYAHRERVILYQRMYND